MKSKNYTDEQFIEAVKTSLSVLQVLKKINLISAGGNYMSFRQKVKELQLDISHFTGSGHLKGKKHNHNKKIPLETWSVR
jgi:hypothetical protein